MKSGCCYTFDTFEKGVAKHTFEKGIAKPFYKFITGFGDTFLKGI